MNDEMIDKIDALVAEKVMGWRWSHEIEGSRMRALGGGPCGWLTPEGGCVNEFSPTRDWSAMGEVEARMRSIDWWYDASSTTNGHGVEFSRLGTDSNPAMVVEAPTLPLAFALASLKAVGVDVREFEEVK